MNDFYVYCAYFDKTWEPAEGGYYVEVSTVDYSEPFFFFEDAYEEWKQRVEFEKECYENVSWINCDVYDEGLYVSEDGRVYTPCADFLRGKYIGEGWRIGISVGKPEGKQYYGYC